MFTESKAVNAQPMKKNAAFFLSNNNCIRIAIPSAGSIPLAAFKPFVTNFGIIFTNVLITDEPKYAPKNTSKK
ncbi:Uncharacterised protein [Catenibacterium mitsuokai]|nr:Uncharacterised protein [Catenibacterium mitsuokai]